MTDYKLVPLEPTPEMVEAAEDAYMPFGDMELSVRMAVLAAPAVQGEAVGVVRLELGTPSVVYGELYSEAAPTLVPGTLLYTAPQPAEQQPAPDVAGLVYQHHRDSAELRRLCQARDEQRDGRLAALERAAKAEADVAQLVEALESLLRHAKKMGRTSALYEKARAALAAHRKQGGEM